MKIFLDTEFTGLHQGTTLISLGMVAEDGREFYAEFDDYDDAQLNPWITKNVLQKLEFWGQSSPFYESQNNRLNVKGNSECVKTHLFGWLIQFDHIEIWADVLAYDWVLFCELFGGAFGIPENIFFAPFDLSTFFRIKGLINPINKYNDDVDRYDYAGVNKERKQHHALQDARVEMICYNKLK